MISHRKNSVLGFLAGLLASIFLKKAMKPTSEDLKKAEFKSSTQRMGLRFTEQIRNIFRFKWIKKV